MRVPRPVRRRPARVVLAALVCSLAVLGGGRAAEWFAVGADSASARARVEAQVRASFDRMARGLREAARAAGDPAAIAGAGRDDAAARRLFDTADALVRGLGDNGAALTVYGSTGQPLAWAGRPGEVPAERLAGDEAWFLAQGAYGLRLVYVTPVAVPDGDRVGAIVVEQLVGPSAAAGDREDVFVVAAAGTPVAIDLGFEDPRSRTDGGRFDVRAPSGQRLLTASVAADDLAATRQRWRRASRSLALAMLAFWVLVFGVVAVESEPRGGRPHVSLRALGGLLMAIAAARALLRLSSPADWSDARVFSASSYASPLFGGWLSSPLDFALTGLACLGTVGVVLAGVEGWRRSRRSRRRTPRGVRGATLFLGAQLAAGITLAAVCVAQETLVRDTIENATVDPLHFSLHPWDTSRLALQVGLLLWHASAVGAGLAVLRLARAPFRLERGWSVRAVVALAALVAPLGLALAARQGTSASDVALLVPLGAVVVLASAAGRVVARFRHGSQALRFALLGLALVAPALSWYPVVFSQGWAAKRQLVESRYAPQAARQRETTHAVLERSLADIDAFPGLADLAGADPDPAGAEAITDRAFQVWRGTGLAEYPITSSVELYDAAGALVSRYAFNLPDDLTTVPRSDEQACGWDVFEEVAPFFAEERRVLHAGRAVCVPDGQGTPRRVGAVVVHAVLDYGNLPFIASQNPYVELLRQPEPQRDEGISGRDVEYVVYGWSRTPLYASTGRAWPLDDGVLADMIADRGPRWRELRREETRFLVYLFSDRGGIYALGMPVASALDHLVNLAELTVLGAGTALVLLVSWSVVAAAAARQRGPGSLLRDIRASFYRRLFLAFVAASVVPVVALAMVTRTYVADQWRTTVEREAIRTAGAASRLVEDLVAPRAGQPAVTVDDNLLVWVSRLIDQDVNIFRGPRLLATSERNLFASGLLPTRTPAEVFRALTLRRDASLVIRERIGTLEYLVAAAPVQARQLDATLTVPLTAREQDIEDQIDRLNRQVLLGALLFILAGSALGYSMAERIADPVNRLTRATRRIARGDLSAAALTTSADELGRLVDDFNQMAADLRRQREALERTNRLEAWAEMARQVAHDIKNPLTPIQLNAEHLRRVHADRGRPLSPVLEDCVTTILGQVRLLRQIASEFSSFASAPTVRASDVDLGELLREVVDPYRAGLAERIVFDMDLPADVPHVHVDRSLMARALTNLIENALHAMTGTGTLRVAAHVEAPWAVVRISDSGRGMDSDALARAFEPYFSTKVTGTGLGLPIAKRNVELNGGTLAISSAPDRGTTVELRLPV